MFAKTILGSMLAAAAVTAAAAWRHAQADDTDPGWLASTNAEAGAGVNARAAAALGARAPAPVQDAEAAPAGTPPLQTVSRAPRQSIAKVTSGTGALPNEDGQVWREYDISPYTLRVTSTNRPEQAIVDWILRETGYEAWHSEPLGLLSANRRTLKVYHTPQMQEVVGEVVDRFVNSEAELHAFGMQIITITSPNWRARAQKMLKPVTVQSQGVQAWLLAKEDAALLVAELRKRTDFRQHSSPHLLVNNGQAAVVAATRPRNYIRNVALLPSAWPGFQAETGQFDEGFSLEMSPLLSLDGNSIDAVIKCHIDQVEKLIPVVLDVPTSVAPRQRTQMDVPQVTSYRLHERFHWPTDQTLLISLGVVPTPAPAESSPLRLPLMGPTMRADLLLLIDSKGATAQPATAATQQDNQSYHGRY